MTTSTTFEKIGDIFKCELTLPNNEKFIIPMREDGYIFATGLCKVSGKRLTKWRENKETKELIKTLDNGYYLVPINLSDDAIQILTNLVLTLNNNNNVTKE